MNFFLVILFCLSAVLPRVSFAQSEETGLRTEVTAEEPWEIRETELEETELEKSSTNNVQADEVIVTKKRGTRYVLRASAIDAESIALFHHIPEAKKKNFHEMRLNIIRAMAAFLNSQSLTIGAGIVSKDKLVGIFKKRAPTEPVLTAREYGIQSVERMLNSLNALLWKKSAKIADSKELTFFINPIGQISLGVPKLTVGYTVGATFAFGYSKENGALFVDIMGTAEKLKSGLVVFVGGKVQYGINFDSSEGTPKRGDRRLGETYYPPVIPFWEGTGKDYYTLATSTAVGIPFAPITDLFTYKHNTLQVRLLRLHFTSAPLWRMVFASLLKVGASDKLLIKYAEKANLDFRPQLCPRLF